MEAGQPNEASRHKIELSVLYSDDATTVEPALCDRTIMNIPGLY